MDESVTLAARNHTGVAFVAAGDWEGMLLANQFADEDTVMVVDNGAQPDAGRDRVAPEPTHPRSPRCTRSAASRRMPVALIDAAAAAVSGPAGSVVDPA